MKFTQQQVDEINNRVARGRSGSAEKATLAQLIQSYLRTKSVWITAGEFGMCGQSVHERLAKSGVINETKPEFSFEQKEEIKSLYQRGFKKGDGQLKNLSKKFKKSQANICRWARKNALTNKRRQHSEVLASAMGRRVSEQWKNGNHPRGMLGKKHSPQTIERISESNKGRTYGPARTLKIMQTRVERYGTTIPLNPHGNWKAAWVEVGGQKFYARSKWEANYARYLEFLRNAGEVKSWQHEPETFWFEGVRRGTCSYLPDFKVVLKNGRVEYHEVKGWMDPRSKTKIKRMAKYHPAVILIVRDATWYRSNKSRLAQVVKGWEK